MKSTFLRSDHQKCISSKDRYGPFEIAKKAPPSTCTHCEDERFFFFAERNEDRFWSCGETVELGIVLSSDAAGWLPPAPPGGKAAAGGTYTVYVYCGGRVFVLLPTRSSGECTVLAVRLVTQLRTLYTTENHD